MATPTKYSWPLQPVQVIMTRVNVKFFPWGLCLVHITKSRWARKHRIWPHSFLMEDSSCTLLASLVCGDMQRFLSPLMTTIFNHLIRRKQANTYFDDTIKKSQNKNEMFTANNELHILLRKAGLKAAPDRKMFFWRTLDSLLRLYHQKDSKLSWDEWKTWIIFNSPENQQDVMKVLGCFGF